MKDNFFKQFYKEFGISGIVFLFLLVLFVGGVGSVFIQRVVFPSISEWPIFREIDFFSPQAPIVINRREEIRIDEGINQVEISSQVSGSMVTVYLHQGSFDSGNYRVLSVLSGMIVTSDGVVVLPFVKDDVFDDLITVVTHRGDILPGEFISADELTGLVFVKIQSSDLPVIRQGFSRTLRTGEKVLAIKSQEAFLSAISIPLTTTGSSLAVPSLVNSYSLKLNNDQLKTDIAADESMIGSAIVDKDGSLVGFTTFLGGSPAILRAEYMKMAIDKFLKDKKITWPTVQFQYQLLGPIQTQIFNLPYKVGMLIKSGPKPLLSDDFIFSINGHELSLQESVQEILLPYNSGDKVRVRFIRDGEEKESELTL